MGGIEVLAVMVMFILGTAGIVRGPARELGVTMALVVLLAVLAQFEIVVEFDQLPAKINTAVSGFGLGSGDPTHQKMMVLLLFSSAIVVTAFLAYHGQETLAFRWQDPPGIAAAALGWLAGAVNGYLIFGTIWYYLDRLDYPIQRYSWFQMPLTDLGQDMVSLLPQNLTSGMILGAMALALLWLRILK